MHSHTATVGRVGPYLRRRSVLRVAGEPANHSTHLLTAHHTWLKSNGGESNLRKIKFSLSYFLRKLSGHQGEEEEEAARPGHPQLHAALGLPAHRHPCTYASNYR